MLTGRARGLARRASSAPSALIAAMMFLTNHGSFTPQYKSDMHDVAGEMDPLLHPNDLVITAQPEQIAADVVLPPERAELRQHDRAG